MTLLIWILLCAGVIGLALGLRGRVVARQLECKSCGYSLEGMQRTPQSKCPECGRSVWTGARVHEAREPNRSLLRVSYGCLAAGALVFSVHTANRLNLIDWQKFRSVNSLLQQISDTTHVNPRASAWIELSRRRAAHQLDDDEVGDIMAIALDRHLSMLNVHSTIRSVRRPSLLHSTRRPNPDHAKWIHAACSERLLSPETVKAYLKRLIEPTVETPFLTQSGHGVYRTVVTLSARGLGGFDNAQVVAMLDKIEVDGVEHEVEGWAAMPLVLDLSPGGSNVARIRLEIPMALPQNARRVALHFRVGLTHLVIGQGTGAIALGQPIGINLDWPRTLVEDEVVTTHQMK